MLGLHALPPEIYSYILSHIPTQDLQQTTLSLTRAIPYSPVPQHHLFTFVRLREPERVVQLYRRLRAAKEDVSSASLYHSGVEYYDHDGGGGGGLGGVTKWIKAFSLETWKADAEVVINVLALVLLHHANLRRVSLFIGPNFAPEHLEEMFRRDEIRVRFLDLRFRPYVQRATYYQFLKGAYFDSTLTSLSQLSAPNLSTLSIVQDPLDKAPTPTSQSKFAQPLVFFSLEPFLTLSVSSFVSKVTHLRLRVPTRNVAPFIYIPIESFPALRLLDMSTSNLKESDVEALLARFTELEHIILDACSIFRVVYPQQGGGGGAETREGEWKAFGKACALSGVRRAKEREKELRSWIEAHWHAHAVRIARESATEDIQQLIPGVGAGGGGGPAASSRRAGRRGIANSTISLRRPAQTNNNTSILSAASSSLPSTALPKIRIFPSPPSLLTLSTTNHILATSDATKHAQFRTEFASGWQEGILQLLATWRRLRSSRSNGVRVVFMDPNKEKPKRTKEPSSASAKLEDGFYGLSELPSDGEPFEKWSEERIVQDQSAGTCPILCFAGYQGSGEHIPGCSHEYAKEVWPNVD